MEALTGNDRWNLTLSDAAWLICKNEETLEECVNPTSFNSITIEISEKCIAYLKMDSALYPVIWYQAM